MASATSCGTPNSAVADCYLYGHNGTNQVCSSCIKGKMPGGSNTQSFNLGQNHTVFSCVAPDGSRMLIDNCDNHYASNNSGATLEFSCESCATGYMINIEKVPRVCFKWKPTSWGCSAGILKNDNFEPACIQCDFRTHYMIEEGVCALRGITATAAVLSLSSLFLGLLMLKV
jgi:hypothetical protein